MPTADQLARRATSASAAEKVFTDTQRQLTEGRRVDARHKTRAPIYRQVRQDLEGLSAQVGALQQALAAAQAAPTPTSVTSPTRLSLGDGSGLTPAGGPVERSLNPAGTLASQPFETAVTNGSLRLAFRVNGGVSTAASVTINKATQSLDDVLTALNDVTIGGVKPLTATFDAAAQQIELKVNSTSGTRFDFTITGGTSNLRTLLGAEQVSTSTAVTANAAIEDSATKKIYNRLTITAEGFAAKAFNLTVSSAALTVDQKVDELVGQLNAGGLATLGLTAVNAGGGKIGLTREVASAPAAPALGVAITQATTASKLKLGFEAGFSTEATIRFDPDLTETLTPPAPASAGLPGTSARLGDLAGQLGLTAVDGRYTITANGQDLSFGPDDTLNDVLAGISAAGVGLYASYDAEAGTITVLNTEGGAVDLDDRAGNLAAALGIRSDAAARDDAALGQTLRDLADALDGVAGLLEASTAPGTGLDSDRLLSDLQASLAGLFASSANGPLSGLGDLGFSRTDGALAVDPSKLQALLAERRGDVETFLGTFIGEKVQPLLRAGSRALASAEEVGAAEAEAAARSVRVRGEIARLQVRQQMLALEQQSFEGLQERLEKQREKLDETAADLRERTPSGLPRDVEETGRAAELLGRDRSGFTQLPTVVAPGTSTPSSPAFGSFGLSGVSTA